MKNIIEKYYCPLTFSMNYCFRGEREDDYELENSQAMDYLPQIAEFVENNDGGEMMECFEDCGIEKLKDVRWSVEVVDGVLYGCIIATLSAPLTFAEDTKLKQEISGQNSDGFGECLEQRPLRVEAGEIYVSFYNSGKKYFVLNKEEFSYYLGKKTPSAEEPCVVTKKRCPKCGAESFYVSAHVRQGWEVDCYGNFVATADECEEVIHQPDDDDIWSCANCGYDAHGREFNVQVKQKPPFSRKRTLLILGNAIVACSSELENKLIGLEGINNDNIDQKIRYTIMKNFGITEPEMASLMFLSETRATELIKKFINAYEDVLETHDYDSEEELHAVVLNEFGMTEEEYCFFTQQ